MLLIKCNVIVTPDNCVKLLINETNALGKIVINTLDNCNTNEIPYITITHRISKIVFAINLSCGNTPVPV